ncbi:type IV pilus twitching motility protein PilT [Agrococcus citreus]
MSGATMAEMLGESAGTMTRAALRQRAQASVEPDTAVHDEPMPTGASSDLLLALEWVVRVGASDLHVTAETPPTMRLDGKLIPLEEFGIWSSARVTAALDAIITAEQRETFELELELDFAFELSDAARFRVNIYQQRSARGAAFRLIPTRIRTIEELELPPAITRFATLPRGLVLVTGPTGSGKSTTLAALIDLINRTRAEHIVTVEDPIEFIHPRKKAVINQREVGHDTHSFSKALKHVLRQDPDIILVGEMRDLETISVALTAAETGHLVFATLHTQSAAQTIDRIIDVYPPHQQSQVRAQLAATLQGVVCQTLVPRASGRGRVAASEVLVATSAISNLIREGQTHQIASALQSGASQGMRTMDQHLAELVNRALVREDDARDKAQNVDEFRGMLAASGAPKLDAGVDFGDTFSKGQRA